ncbi:helix-turn-helix domain-containing protein [Cylindrospermum sp. FACHB-282]|uniref:helix-turn-helix domain-containing protein n=1 Tax=Cylindrospermum sp. FACHB-282 TaxID=2692794 RepID=UPI001684EF6C|nr:helix-turn-helix domain-containing protein [Cylindrospermum sp. FACHB-282]MBD2388825.1 helix-turn-helix domain-containing protein [Cylindrospermum sp. FACHB-282]
MSAEDKLFSKKDVAVVCKVSTRTVERWAERGWLRKVVIGGVVRFRPDDVETLVRQGLRTAN